MNLLLDFSSFNATEFAERHCMTLRDCTFLENNIPITFNKWARVNLMKKQNKHCTSVSTWFLNFKLIEIEKKDRKKDSYGFC